MSYKLILSRAHFLRLSIAIAAAMVVGCGPRGPEVAKVRGIVLLDGKPLKKGHVATIPSAGKGANGFIQPDGSFELSTFGDNDGALVGTHKVGIAAYDGATKSPEGGYGKLLVPKKYTNPETSGLTIEVKSGNDNSTELNLTSP
jgi:hypothetical protein